jgi:hypothetical protein
LSAGSVSGYACAVPECALPTPEDDGSLTVAFAEIGACYPALSGSTPAALPSPVETFFRYTVTSATSAGDEQSRDAVLQVPLWIGALPPGYAINLPPEIESVAIGGSLVYEEDPSVQVAAAPVLANGSSLLVQVLIDPSSVQTYVDAAGQTQSETMTVDYYATAGRFASDSATGIDTQVALDGESFTAADLAAGTLEVYVVALDLRGGQAVAGPFTVPIGP